MAEPRSVEEYEGALQNAKARVRKLAAAVEAEEGTLVRTALEEAEETAAAAQGLKPVTRPAALQGPRPTEQRLRSQVAQAEVMLRKEHDKFKALLADGNVRLALAVEQGVDSYYEDVRTVRRRGNPVHGPTQAVAQASSALRKLNGERGRLADAVRALNEESEALDAEARVVAQSKQTLIDALRRRDAMHAGARYR